MANGRPPKYKKVSDLQKKIDSYFDKCKPEYGSDDKGRTFLIALNPPTITGLALHLGFNSRKSFYNYEADDKFLHTMKMARTRCENFVETNSMSGVIPPAVGIFALKNYGWKDNQSIDLDAKIDTNINILPVSPDGNKDS